MRRKLTAISDSSLTIHLEFDHITLSELGNILIRLQAALRSLTGLSPGEYDFRYSKAQPHFIAKSVSSEHSIDVNLVLAVLAIVLDSPGTINEWTKISSEVFRRFKMAVVAMVKGEITYPDSDDNEEKIEIESVDNVGAGAFQVKVTEGTIEMSRKYLSELTTTQRKKLFNFLWSITGPIEKVDIGNQESRLSLKYVQGEENKALE